MLGLAIIDMQRWMFRYPERAAQIPLLVGNVNALASAFVEIGLPIFDVRDDPQNRPKVAADDRTGIGSRAQSTIVSNRGSLSRLYFRIGAADSHSAGSDFRRSRS